MIKEFLGFLKEYKIVGLAIAFVMGVASTSLVKSLVDNIVMPLVTPFVPNWKEAVLNLGPFAIKWGAFTGELINFLIVAFIVFIIAEKILKHEWKMKKMLAAKLLKKKK